MADETKLFYKNHLVERVPEAFQESDNLIEYLRAAGKLFDDASEQIKLHDWYEDYRKTPEQRLELLISKYGINITKILPEEIIRSIVRDIHTIYTTNGTNNALEWVFRLINISYTIEDAWLIDPELYFDNLYLGKDIPGYDKDNPFDNLREGEEYLKIGRISSDSYVIGQDNQFWLEDTSYRIIGIPKIGPNEVRQEGTTIDEDLLFGSALKQRSLNYTEFDYKNFVYGGPVDQDNGTYFYGRTFNSEEQNVEELRIVGEEYGVGARRQEHFVSATPYVLLSIKSEDYSRFINGYTVNKSEGYTLSKEDKMEVNQYLFDYLLLEVVKPSTVVILTITQKIDLSDKIGYDDNIEFIPQSITLDINDASYSNDIVGLYDNLDLELAANIPDPNPTTSFVCVLNAPSCESHVPIIDSHYEIGAIDQEYHNNADLVKSGNLKIGFNDFCNVSLSSQFGAEVTLSWDEQPGVDGYKVYKSSSPFDSTSLPDPVDDISDYQKTEYKHNADNGEQFYYAVEPYITQGSTVSSIVSEQVSGCIPPFEDFNSNLVDQTCMFPIDDFIITEASVDYPEGTDLRSFSITSDNVQCDLSDVSHPVAANEGYSIGDSNIESHLYTGFTNSGVILIGDNDFSR